MQVKLFNTRMDADNLVRDQQAINSFMESVAVKNTATQFVNGNPDFWSILVFYEKGEDRPQTKSVPAQVSPVQDDSPKEVSEEETQLLQALKIWRKDKATELQQPEFMIFPNATLNGLAKAKPRTMAELNQVKGIGEAKITRYGDDLMAILNAF